MCVILGKTIFIVDFWRIRARYICMYMDNIKFSPTLASAIRNIEDPDMKAGIMVYWDNSKEHHERITKLAQHDKHIARALPSKLKHKND